MNKKSSLYIGKPFVYIVLDLTKICGVYSDRDAANKKRARLQENCFGYSTFSVLKFRIKGELINVKPFRVRL